MASNSVVLKGTTYNGVSSLEVPKSGGGTALFTDVSDTTAAAADVASGKYFYTSAGAYTAGTASGGGSSYTLLDSFDVEASTTSTSTTTLTTYSIAITNPADEMIYIQVRDKAGARSGYFYGTDLFLPQPQDGSIMNAYRGLFVLMANSNGVVSTTTSTYGVYLQIQSIASGTYNFNVNARYNSSYTGTIDGTYAVNIYRLSWPSGVSPFE